MNASFYIRFSDYVYSSSFPDIEGWEEIDVYIHTYVPFNKYSRCVEFYLRDAERFMKWLLVMYRYQRKFVRTNS